MKRKCLNSDEDSSIGDAIGDVNGGRAMDSPILNLLDLGEGPLNDILEFVNPFDLTRAESVCKTLQTAALSVWKSLANRLPAFTREEMNLFGAADESDKDRVVRWTRASEYAKRMEQAAADHFDYDCKLEFVKCGGCNELPSLDIRFLEDPNRVFFIRLSYRKDADDRLICQGFVPKVPDPSRAHLLRRFDITDVLYKEGGALIWPELQHIADFVSRPSPCMRSQRLLQLKEACFGNATVTVVAMSIPGTVISWWEREVTIMTWPFRTGPTFLIKLTPSVSVPHYLSRKMNAIILISPMVCKMQKSANLSWWITSTSTTVLSSSVMRWTV